MGRLRIPAAVLAAVAVAEAAVLLVRPREGVIDPGGREPVRVGSYFSRAEIERATSFRGPQVWLFAGSAAIQTVLLVALVARPPRRLSTGRWFPGRPILGAAAAGAGLSVLLGLAPLPLHVVMRERAKAVGLVTQGLAGYARDTALSTAIGAAIAAGGAAAGVALLRRLPRGWWLPGAGAVVAFGTLTLYLGPVVLDPLFNRFQTLGPGRTRSDVLDVARRAGVDVDRVLVMDASRRTTAANAYVTGLGRTKRVVLYDTLLDGFTAAEVRLVVAHELAHVRHRDVPRGLLFLVIVAPPAMFLASTILRRLDRSPVAGPHTVPALVAAVLLVAVPVSLVSNALSRRIERRADSFSLRVTDAPQDFISFERRIALRNVADPDPPAALRLLLGTHPSIIERIAIAEAYRAGVR